MKQKLLKYKKTERADAELAEAFQLQLNLDAVIKHQVNQLVFEEKDTLQKKMDEEITTFKQECQREAQKIHKWFSISLIYDVVMTVIAICLFFR